MTLQLQEATRHKLDHLPEVLQREFADIASDRVRHEVEAVTGQILAEATIDDFLPVLVYRYARDHLRDLKVDSGWLPDRQSPYSAFAASSSWGANV